MVVLSKFPRVGRGRGVGGKKAEKGGVKEGRKERGLAARRSDAVP